MPKLEFPYTARLVTVLSGDDTTPITVRQYAADNNDMVVEQFPGFLWRLTRDQLKELIIAALPLLLEEPHE